MRVYLGVGSNLGEREENLAVARKSVCKDPRICFLRSSPVYETNPVGGPPQGKFLNAAWEVETELAPEDLLGVLRAVEYSLGRRRHLLNEPRTIDLDILFYDGLIVEREGLKIPHPRLCGRRFVLKPLSDLIPDFIHPAFGRSVKDLLEHCDESC